MPRTGGNTPANGHKWLSKAKVPGHPGKTLFGAPAVFETFCGVLRSPAVSSGLERCRAVHRSGWNLALRKGMCLEARVAGVWSSPELQSCACWVLAPRRAPPIGVVPRQAAVANRGLDGVNEDRICDLLLAKRPLPRPIRRRKMRSCGTSARRRARRFLSGCSRTVSDYRGFRHFQRRVPQRMPGQPGGARRHVG
jgi:hypothetical protein